MRNGFYTRLALQTIKQNKKFYLPYVVACMGTLAVNYIIAFLSHAEVFNHMSGGYAIAGMMDFGTFVVGAFACIFLYYTNSFLFKNRKKELGLYNVLGMNKKNLAALLFVETFMVFAFSLVSGLVLGIACSKMAELALCKLAKATEVYYSFNICPAAILETIELFVIVFVLIYFSGLFQIRKVNTIDLMKSKNAGEKPPKGNLIIGFVGLAILIFAYYIAVTISNPIEAISLFFVAVIMVIVATYMIFISSSVVFCRLLKKNKKFYYKPRHFVSVSSMAYRMKRNGAGLASICILATMVLVMLSGSACLYFGSEESLNSRFPYDINLNASYNDENTTLQKFEDFRLDVEAYFDEKGYVPTAERHFFSESTVCNITDGIINYDEEVGLNYWYVEMFRESEYNRLSGSNLKIEPGNAVLFQKKAYYKNDFIGFENGKILKIAEAGENTIDFGDSITVALPSLMLVVNDDEDIELDNSGLFCGYNFDGLSTETKIQMATEIAEIAKAYSADDKNRYYVDGRDANRADFYGSYGGIFFLGIMLSVVFLLATVLIIYYKQITEGYEDQAGFEIMQKVGMTDKEIRSSINSQILMVFFLPLITAVIHLAFAFPVIRKLLMLFNLLNLPLLLTVAGISIFVFAIIYILIYKLTSNTYYEIVSGGRA